MRSEVGYVSEKARIGGGVTIGTGAVIYDNVEIGDNSIIGPYCVIGEPVADYYLGRSQHEFSPTRIGANSIVRSFTTIYEGVSIGDSFHTGHHAVIREGTTIGQNTSFGSFSETPGRSTIGDYVRIHSKVMLSENNLIEDYVWIYPFVVLTNVRYPPVGPLERTHIKEYAQILSHAVILPGITIGKDAIVGAGSLVVRDVGDERLVVGNPGRDVKSVRDIKDAEGRCVYPWRDHLRTNRGYPWQERG